MLAGFALKSVFRRLGRYRFLAAMIGLGIAATVLVQAVTEGMAANVIEGSSRYLGGRYLVVSRRSRSTRNFVQGPSELLRVLAQAGIEPRLAVRREVAADNQPTLFFNGQAFELRRVTGADFRAEAEIFSRLSFPAGGFEAMPGSRGILLSAQVAARFGAKVGDLVTLRLQNLSGYLDSAVLEVQGVFEDASIFGYYNCYVDFELLRGLMGEEGEDCSFLGLYFDGREDVEATSSRISAALASAYTPFESLRDKADADKARFGSWAGTKVGVLPVERYIDAKVMDLIAAVRAVSTLFLALALAMIAIGTRNSTQIMTVRRTREIGTIRALGLTRPRTRRLVLGESVALALFGFALGLAAALSILAVLGAFRFRWSGGFDIFLAKGRLSWRLSPGFLALDLGALLLMTAAGALPAAGRAARIEPAAAISSSE